MATQIRRLIKKCFGFLAFYYLKFTGRLTGHLTVFVFHEVSDAPSEFSKDNNLYCTVDTFRRQLEWISDFFVVVHPCEISQPMVTDKKLAIITFDDGFRGVFDNALPILAEKNIPSVVFLNMQPVVERVPLLPALICYLEAKSKIFIDFANNERMATPRFLNISPLLLHRYEESGEAFDISNVIQYQGEFVDINTLKEWSNSRLVVFGNHLFQHWNSRALRKSEFAYQFQTNLGLLEQLTNHCELFAFPYGQRGSCWNEIDVEHAISLGATSVFSSMGGINQSSRNNKVIDRIGLSEEESDSHLFWYKIGRAASRPYSK